MTRSKGFRLGLALGLALGGLAIVGLAVIAVSELTGRAETNADSREVGRRTVILDDRPWLCTGRVDLDLVRVTLRTKVDDAIRLGERCTGRIKRVEVQTWTADGIKVGNDGSVAHDLIIESGYVRCHDVARGAHQDGVHVMGGRHITFRNLRVDCLGNANLFFSKGGEKASTPTDVVCEGCVLGPHSGQTLFYGRAVRSGARDTTICTGRFRAIRIDPRAREIVTAGNEVLAEGHPSCEDVIGESLTGSSGLHGTDRAKV